MRARIRPFTVATTAGLASVALCIATPSAGWAGGGNDNQGEQGPLVTTILAGASLSHTFTVGGTAKTEKLSHPDDLTSLGNDIFVAFQNGVGPQGEPTASGNTDSTVVELTTTGTPLAQWDVTGKVDGLTADPALSAVIATVNEDGNSSLYTITPGGGGTSQHYSYNDEPLPHFGGTDAISIVGGQIFVSASAPGTPSAAAPAPPGAPQPTYPAVYSVTLDQSTLVATVTPVFFDEDPAVVANVGSQQGQTVTLGLTDPDSSEVVPVGAPRFGGEFMLGSQGDQQQVFLNAHAGSGPMLSVLNLSQSVDDTAWPQPRGTLLATDSTHDTIDAITGGFPDRPVVAVTPCGSNSAPSTCPAPPQFPANYLGTVNPLTGRVDPLATTGVAIIPQGGLLFVPAD